MNSVLRSHNCNWMESRKIAKEFSTYKYQLNAAKLNVVKMEPLTYTEIKKENLLSAKKFVLQRDHSINVASYKPKVIKKEVVVDNTTAAHVASVTSCGELKKACKRKEAVSKQAYQSNKKNKTNLTGRRKSRPEDSAPVSEKSIDLVTIAGDTGEALGLGAFSSSDPLLMDPLLMSSSDVGINWHHTCVDEQPEPASDERCLEIEEGETAHDVRRMDLKSEPSGSVETEQEESANISVRQMECEWEQEDDPDTKPAISALRKTVDGEQKTKVSDQQEAEHGTDQVDGCNDNSFQEEAQMPADLMDDYEMNQSEQDQEKTPEVNSFVDDTSPAVEYTSDAQDTNAGFVLMETDVPGQYLKVFSNKQGCDRLWPNTTTDGQYFLTDNNEVTSNTTLNSEIKPLMDPCGKLIISDNNFDSSGYQYSTAGTFCIPGITQAFPIQSPLPGYPSTSVAASPVLVNQVHSQFISNPSLAPSPSFFSPSMSGGSYIRAHTQDGAELLLPSNTCFTIVDANGSETNSTELQFNGSSTPIMIRSQPVLQHQHSPAFMTHQPTQASFESITGVIANYSPSVQQPTSVAEDCEERSDQSGLTASSEALAADDVSGHHTSSDSPIKKTLFASLNLKPSPTKRQIQEVASSPRRSLRRLARQEAGLSLGSPTDSIDPSEESSSSRSAVRTCTTNSPTKTYRSPAKEPTSPTKALSSSIVTPVSPAMTHSSIIITPSSPPKLHYISTKTPDSPIITSNNFTDTSTQYAKTNPSKSSSPSKTNVFGILSHGNDPLVTYSSSPMKSPIVHCTVSASSSSFTAPQLLHPSVTASPNLAASKRPVCSFLVAKKFKPLQPAFGTAAAGSASGKPPQSPQVNKPRVSFFRKGTLGSKTT